MKRGSSSKTMSKKTFSVKTYYSTFSTQIVEADNEQDAIQIARNKALDEKDELLSNLEPWEEADTLEEVKHYEDSPK